MPQMKNPQNGDVRVVPAALTEKYLARGWQVASAELVDLVNALRGADLDTALTESGLSKSGTVAEKRARLLEHATAAVAAGAVDITKPTDPAADAGAGAADSKGEDA